MAIGQLVRRVGQAYAKRKAGISKFGLHTKQDISSAVGTAVRRGGDVAGKLGLKNLSNTLHKNSVYAERAAFNHPVKTALGGLGLLGAYKANKMRKKSKKK